MAKKRPRPNKVPVSEPEPRAPDVFQQLPRELHEEIFRKCLQETYPNSTWRRTRMPVRLSQVARSWRNIALADTTLWTVIATPPSYKPTDEHIVERAKTYIKRSGTRPLDLFVHFDGKRAVSLFESIFAQMHRWRQIHFTATIDSSWFEKFKGRLADARVPQLEHMSILGVVNPHLRVIGTDCIGDAMSTGLDARIFLNGAPLLQSFVLNNDGFRYLLPPLHWRIRLLHIREASPANVHEPPFLLWGELKEIMTLPNLEDLMITGCAFHFCGVDNDSDDSDSDDSDSDNIRKDPDPIIAPSLRSFCFDWAPYSGGVSHLKHILTHLIADKLERLAVTCAMVADSRNLLQFDNDATNYFPSVTTLEIRNCFFGYSSYLYFMNLCPNLQVLNIWLHFAGDQELLESLEVRVSEEREAEDPGQQDPDWDLYFNDADCANDSRWWREQDAVFDAEDPGPRSDHDIARTDESDLMGGSGETSNNEEPESTSGGDGTNDVEEPESTSGGDETSDVEELESTSGGDGTSDAEESELTSNADSEESDSSWLDSCFEAMQLFQARHDLFKELKRAERKFSRFEPGWPSLSIFGYKSLSTSPSFGKTRHWLEYRQNKGAAKLSALKIPTSWLSDDDQSFQVEMDRIKTYVDSVEGMDEDWGQYHVTCDEN